MTPTRKTDRMDIYIHEHAQRIMVQLKWKYEYKISIGTTNWTKQQKVDFHHQADALIWSKWSGKLKVGVKGTSDFARKYEKVAFIMDFDIKWVLSDPHWNVTVTKIPPGNFASSNVEWDDRKITFDTEDVKKRSDIDQWAIAHEFGHAVGNSKYSMEGGHGDEYTVSNPFDLLQQIYKLDKNSMMNKGSELRSRHIDYVVSQLNLMIPDTTFYAL